MKTMILGCMLMATAAVFGVAGAANAQEEPYCREYQQKVTIGGVVKNTYGTACMQPDGSWQKTDGGVLSSDDVQAAPIQVAQSAPVIVQQQPVVVYEQPVYSDYRYYPGPAIGLSFGWDNHDWHGGGGRGWGGGHGGGWHH